MASKKSRSCVATLSFTHAEIVAQAREAMQLERCTKKDVETITNDLVDMLGWSKERVLCEALLRLFATVDAGEPLGQLLAYDESRTLEDHIQEIRRAYARLGRAA